MQPLPPDTFPLHIQQLKAYTPGLPIDLLAQRLKLAPQHIVKLASNENPLGPSPLALAALAAAPEDLARYPDNDCTALTAALAAHLGVAADEVVVGPGSEGVISMAVAALLAPGRATAYAQYSFQAYAVAAQRAGANARIVPSPAFTVDLEALAREARRSDASLVYIANPGNPTGTCVDPAALEAFLADMPSHVVTVLDEAYREYLPEDSRADSMAWVRRFPNLLVTRTFSKAYGLAGLRVGYGVAQPALADMLRRVRPPFSVTQPAQRAATAALQDTAFLAATREANGHGKQQLCGALERLGLRYLPSSTNFVLAEVGDGAALAQHLEAQGLITRALRSYGLDAWLRISVGTAAENTRLANALAQANAARFVTPGGSQ